MDTIPLPLPPPVIGFTLLLATFKKRRAFETLRHGPNAGKLALCKLDEHHGCRPKVLLQPCVTINGRYC